MKMTSLNSKSVFSLVFYLRHAFRLIFLNSSDWRLCALLYLLVSCVYYQCAFPLETVLCALGAAVCRISVAPHRHRDMGAVWLFFLSWKEKKKTTLVGFHFATTRCFCRTSSTFCLMCGRECVSTHEHAFITAFVWYETGIRSPAADQTARFSKERLI